MGCDSSKPSRQDLPTQGTSCQFEARPAVASQRPPSDGDRGDPEPETDLTIYDAVTQSKWFMLNVTGGGQPDHAKVARLQGPCGLDKDKQETPIVLAIGASSFTEVLGDGPEDTTAAEEESKWESWPKDDSGKDHPFKQTKWKITRSVVGTNARGRAEVKAEVTFIGCTRVSETAGTCEILRVSKCSSSAYKVILGGKPQTVEGGRTESHVALDQEDGPGEQEEEWEMTPHGARIKVVESPRKKSKDPLASLLEKQFEGKWEFGSFSVECFLRGEQRCSRIQVGELDPPLGGLCLGVAMQRWLHPLAAEEFADAQALNQF